MLTARVSGARFIAHVRTLWGNAWVLPLLPLAYAGIMASIGELRLEHVVAALAVAGLGFGTAATKRLLVIGSPAVMGAVLYDLVRYVQPLLVVPRRVLGCQMRDVELALFAQAPNVTWADYFAAHHTAFFDLYFAVPYGIFLYVAIAYAVYLFVYDRPRMRQYVWSLSAAYVLAIGVWLAMPTAAPWYIRAYGCAIDVSAAPSAAGLLRVDHLLGIHYFQDFYARAPATFAAFPSMHCAFPMIGLLTAWRSATGVTRPIHVLYVASMLVGSVYLGHHWLIDGLAGLLLATIAVASARFFLPPRSSVVVESAA